MSAHSWSPRARHLAVAAVLCLTASTSASSQAPSYTLGLQGPKFIHGPAGGVARGTYFVILEGTGAGAGAEAWSFGLQAVGARVTGITLSGTDGNWAHAGGFEHSGIVGSSAATSTVSLPSFIRLEHDVRHRIAAIDVEADIAADGGRHTMRLGFVVGLVGPSGPVAVTVRDGGADLTPTYSDPVLEVELRDDASCVPISLGFSTEKMEDPTPFAGIVGGESTAGEAVLFDLPGEAGAHHVFVNLVTTFSDDQVHPPSSPAIFGWAFSLPLEGEAECLGATVKGTIMDRYGAGFSKTECVSPAKNGGRKGITAAFVQFFYDPFINIPAVGTYSVLDIQVAADAPPGSGVRTGQLRFEDGLVGSGQPVMNGVTLDGATVYPCNLFEAAATLRFREDPGLFVRGNANDDERVDISDAVWILGDLFLGATPTTCLDAADANDDGAVDITDAVFILNFQFLGGRAIPPPYPDCGTDPSGEDGIGCGRSDTHCF